MSAARAYPIANESPFCEARAQMKKIEEALVGADAMHMTHDAIERLVVTESRELARRLLQAHYDVRAAQEQVVAVKPHDRAQRERLRASIRSLETLLGPVEVQRLLYQGDDVAAKGGDYFGAKGFASPWGSGHG